MFKHLGFLTFSFVVAMVLTVRAVASDLPLTKTLGAAAISVNDKGLAEFDRKSWTSSRESDGTEIIAMKTAAKSASASEPGAKAAIVRSTSGDDEAVTTYTLKGANENASMLFFDKGSLKAFTQCEDRGEKDLGRLCITATPGLCHAMKESNVQPDTMKEMDTFEMRALAMLLTLRGADHQLDNMVKTGNKLGLKTALQTTKGQLLALARVVAKESGHPIAGGPAMDEKQAQVVLERELPRLKQACLDTHFN